MNRTTVKKQANSKGVIFALVSGADGFEVWKLCENYSGTVRGGIARQWRYVQKGMDQVSAESLFNRRVAA
jgi:hypothetical protein